jgi:hypothetical protein
MAAAWSKAGTGRGGASASTPGPNASAIGRRAGETTAPRLDALARVGATNVGASGRSGSSVDAVVGGSGIGACT